MKFGLEVFYVIWKHLAGIFVLDVLLIYFTKPENPLYVLFLSFLLWRISYADLSGIGMDVKLLFLLFLAGAFIYEKAVLIYFLLCGMGAAAFYVFCRFHRAEQNQHTEAYIPYDLAGLILVLLYYLLALPMPHWLYQLAFLPLEDQNMRIFGVEIVSVSMAALFLRSHFKGDRRKGIFYGVLFGLCNPLVSLISMLIGHLIRYGIGIKSLSTKNVREVFS